MGIVWSLTLLTILPTYADEGAEGAAATPNLNALVHPNGAEVVNIAPAGSGIFMARDIQLYEGHWQGMDVMLLDAELRRKLKYPLGLKGVIINEVTLNSALSGMLGGDVVIAIEGQPITSLEDFQQQSYLVRQRNHVAVTVLRKTDELNGDRYIMNRMVFILRAQLEVGVAQMESAPMILPGDTRPHPERGACTKCHSIGDGRFTMPDPDLITLPPPPIKVLDVQTNNRPHNDRGPCVACHQIQ